MWFSGVHSDVGGGYPDRALGDLALLWMAGQAAAAGLAFTEELHRTAPPDALAAQHESRKGFYRLMRPGVRDLVGTAGGSAASSAWRRMRERPGYHPENLRAYLATDPPMTDVRDR